VLLLRDHPEGLPPRLVHLRPPATDTIGAFIDSWNDHPHPSTWIKDADEILGKIHRAKTKTSALTHH
jgi:hypothetical protein